MVALGELRANALVEELGGGFQRHREIALDAGGERVAAAAVGEGDDVSFAARFSMAACHEPGLRWGVSCGRAGC